MTPMWEWIIYTVACAALLSIPARAAWIARREARGER